MAARSEPSNNCVNARTPVLRHMLKVNRSTEGIQRNPPRPHQPHPIPTRVKLFVCTLCVHEGQWGVEIATIHTGTTRSKVSASWQQQGFVEKVQALDLRYLVAAALQRSGALPVVGGAILRDGGVTQPLRWGKCLPATADAPGPAVLLGQAGCW